MVFGHDAKSQNPIGLSTYLFFGHFGPGFRSDDPRLHFRQLKEKKEKFLIKTGHTFTSSQTQEGQSDYKKKKRDEIMILRLTRKFFFSLLCFFLSLSLSWSWP